MEDDRYTTENITIGWARMPRALQHDQYLTANITLVNLFSVNLPAESIVDETLASPPVFEGNIIPL